MMNGERWEAWHRSGKLKKNLMKFNEGEMEWWKNIFVKVLIHKTKNKGINELSSRDKIIDYPIKPFTDFKSPSCKNIRSLTLNVVAGHKLQDLINEDDREGKFQDHHPLLNWQRGQLEDHLLRRRLTLEVRASENPHMGHYFYFEMASQFNTFPWFRNKIGTIYLQAGGQHRWSWSAGTWKGSWQQAARSCSMGACAAETDSQTSWKKKRTHKLRPKLRKWILGGVRGNKVLEPVKSVAHLNGDQHRQGHGHGWSCLKDFTFETGKVLVLIVALHEVGLNREDGSLVKQFRFVCCRHVEKNLIAYQLVVGDAGTSAVIEEPPCSTANSSSTNVSCLDWTATSMWSSVCPAFQWDQIRVSNNLLTTNSHVSEEKPARDQGLLGGTWGLAHDVQVRGVEAQSGGGQTISDQVDPEQLDRDQSLGQTQSSSQEDTEQTDSSVSFKNVGKTLLRSRRTLTRRPHRRWRKWGSGWTASCCCR